MLRIWTCVLVCAVLSVGTISFTAEAFADSISEIGGAGDTLATAQDITGGSYDLITGRIGSRYDVDMFEFLWGGGAFTATTYGQTGTLNDPQLFLFDATGDGVLGNDDTYGLHPEISGNLAAGTYYLAITSYNRDPFDSSGTNIFPGNSGPYGGELSYWYGRGSGCGCYRIALSTTSVVPEPTSLGLFGLGAAAIAVGRRRRKRKLLA